MKRTKKKKTSPIVYPIIFTVAFYIILRLASEGAIVGNMDIEVLSNASNDLFNFICELIQRGGVEYRILMEYILFEFLNEEEQKCQLYPIYCEVFSLLHLICTYCTYSLIFDQNKSILNFVRLPLYLKI